MNTKLLSVLLGLLAASSVSATLEAASTAGSLDAEIADFPECTKEVLGSAGLVLSKNDRKKTCQTDLGVKELLNITANDTTTLRAMCENVACIAALKALYPVMPDCRYEDWALKYSVGKNLKFCGIKPETIPTTVGSGADDAGSVETDAPITVAASSSSGGGDDFAPVGPDPTPSPTTTAPAQLPSPAPTTSGATNIYATTTAVAAVVIAAAVVAV